MRIALLFLLVALIVIPSADGWRRRRWRFRVRIPRIRKVIKKVFRPVTKVVKPIVKVLKPITKVVKVVKKPITAIVKPVVNDVVKPVLKKIEDETKKVVKPVLKKIEDQAKKVVKPVMKLAEKGMKAVLKPILKPLQKKVCGAPEEEPEDQQPEEQVEYVTEAPEIVYDYQYVTSAPEYVYEYVTAAPSDSQPSSRQVRETEEEHLLEQELDDKEMEFIRRVREVEDQLDLMTRGGRDLEGLNEFARDEKHVDELDRILRSRHRSKRLMKTVGKLLCGGGGDEGEEEEVEEQVPVTEVEYVTQAAPPAA